MAGPLPGAAEVALSIFYRAGAGAGQGGRCSRRGGERRSRQGAWRRWTPPGLSLILLCGPRGRPRREKVWPASRDAEEAIAGSSGEFGGAVSLPPTPRPPLAPSPADPRPPLHAGHSRLSAPATPLPLSHGRPSAPATATSPHRPRPSRCCGRPPRPAVACDIDMGLQRRRRQCRQRAVTAAAATTWTRPGLWRQ